MKNYKITVNGKVYDVSVEASNDAVSQVTAATPAPAVEAPPTPPSPATATPAPATATPAAPAPAAEPAGETKIEAPMPGTILSIAKAAGDAVSAGDVILILEAMKMENEITAPIDGTIASINTSVGASVNPGDILATI